MLKYVDGLKGVIDMTIARKVYSRYKQKLYDLCRYMDVDPGHIQGT